MLLSAPAAGAEPFARVADEVNAKVVKLFGGGGGFRGVSDFATGILVSADGHILSNSGQLIDTSEVVVHLADGRRMKAGVVATEPLLDLVLLQIRVPGKAPGEPTGLELPFFDIAAAAKRPRSAPGDWVLAFSNCFEIAMRDEPVSVQRGVVASVGKLAGRRGIFEFAYAGDVYVVDAITNNPGSGGGALTDRAGKLIGIIGRELRNRSSETWINYALPADAAVEARDGDKGRTVTLPGFVAEGIAGKYRAAERAAAASSGPTPDHGVVFVADVLPRTPPYIDRVRPDSPAAKAGLRPDDLVSFADGEPVASVKAFEELVRRRRPGETLRLEVRRGAKLMAVEVVLGK